jgi:hypothetical protein
MLKISGIAPKILLPIYSFVDLRSDMLNPIIWSLGMSNPRFDIKSFGSD